MNDQPTTWDRWLRVAAVFLTVLAARWWLIGIAGSPVPFWDQWYSDVHDVRAVADGEFWRGLFQPHNEHRIVFTRLLNRLLILIDGQWDPLSQMYAAAVVHATAAALLASWLSRGLAHGFAGSLSLVVAAVYALPHGWQNTLWGFQSQFSFLLLFSFACLAWLGSAGGPGDFRWWWGLLAGIAAELSMAAGAIAGAALVGVAGWELLSRRTWTASTSWRLFAGSLVIALGWWTRTPVAGHALLESADSSQFAAVFISALAWPNQNVPLLFAIANGPWLLWTVRAITRRSLLEPFSQTVALIGAWAILQAAAFAYFRGGAATFGFEAASRYQDLLAVLAAANALAIALWIREATANSGRSRRIALAAAALWSAVLAIGLVTGTRRVLTTEIAGRRQNPEIHGRLVALLRSDADAERIYDQLPAAFQYWQPADAIRGASQDQAVADRFPPELQPHASPGRPAHGRLVRWARTAQKATFIFAVTAWVSSAVLLGLSLPRRFYRTIRSTSRSSSASGAQPRAGKT